MVEANRPIVDQVLVECGPNGLFAGVYDGHGGHRVSELCSDKLFLHFMRIASSSGSISENTLKDAMARTEQDYMNIISGANPAITKAGSCCLIGVIWKGTLYVANLGDSRAVIGRLNTRTNKVVAEVLTKIDNVNLLEVRRDIWAAHPHIPDVLLKEHGKWHIKGDIEASKAIGDAYLKKGEHYGDQTMTQTLPIISTDPSLVTIELRASDRFVICTSRGLWDHISTHGAVEIVSRHPPQGIARRLVKAAIKVAARKSRYRYDQIKASETIDRGVIHDDITAVVIFFNHEVGNDASERGFSVRGFREPIVMRGRFNLQGVA